MAARYQGTLCIACDLDVDFDELAEFIAGSGAMEVECLSPIMDELLPRIPYRLRQRQTVMTYDFDREGQPGFPPAAVLSERNFIYSDHLDSDADAFVENRELREMYEVICQCFEGFRENSPFRGGMWIPLPGSRRRRAISAGSPGRESWSPRRGYTISRRCRR